MGDHVTGGRRAPVLLVLVVAVVVNLPLLHSSWTDSRIDRSGTDVTATVAGHRATGSEHWLSFVLPSAVDPDHKTRQAEVDDEAYDAAVSSGRVRVRVLEDDPSVYRVDGAVSSDGIVVVTAIADVALVVIALLLWRFGGRRRVRLRAVALEDVQRCEPEILLERLQGEDYLIRGAVAELAPGRLVLDLRNRTVEVLLDGHANPVDHQQPAQVRARLIS